MSVRNAHVAAVSDEIAGPDSGAGQALLELQGANAFRFRSCRELRPERAAQGNTPRRPWRDTGRPALRTCGPLHADRHAARAATAC